MTISTSHYGRKPSRLIAAKMLAVDDNVETISVSCKVTKVKRIVAVGLYALRIMHRDIVVDGVVSSSYAQYVHPRVAKSRCWPFDS